MLPELHKRSSRDASEQVFELVQVIQGSFHTVGLYTDRTDIVNMLSELRLRGMQRCGRAYISSSSRSSTGDTTKVVVHGMALKRLLGAQAEFSDLVGHPQPLFQFLGNPWDLVSMPLIELTATNIRSSM
jgi:hypothetical protein